MRIILLLISIITITSLQGQELTHNDTLCFCHGRPMMEGKKLNRRLEQELFTKYPASSVEYKKGINRSALAGMCIITGITCGVISLFRINKKDGFFSPLPMAFLGTTILSIPLISSSDKHIKKGVWLYNRGM